MAQYQGVFPTPQAPAGVRANSDSLQITPESQQHLDSSTPELQSPGSKKPSLIEKIKDKTSRLKTKVKSNLHHRTADKDNTAGTTAEHDSSSSSSSEDESEKTPLSQAPYSQLPKQGDPLTDSRDYTPNNTPSGREGGVDLKEDPDAVVPRSSEDGRTADFISPFRNPGPSDTLQAVPTQYFYKESLTASLDPPTGETISRSQQDMPSAAGQVSSGPATDVPGWAGNTELPTTTSREYHTGVLDDSVTKGPFPTDQEEFKGQAAAQRDDLPFTERLKEAAAAAGSAETAKHHLDGASLSDESKPYTQRAAEGLTNAKDRVANFVTPGSDTQQSGPVYDDKPSTERAKDNLTSAKDTVVGAAYGTTGQDASPDQRPFSERATEGLYNAKDTAVGAVYDAKDRLTGNTTSSTPDERTYTEQARDGVYAAKDNLVGAARAAKDKVAGNTDSYGEQKPLTEKAVEGIYNAKDRVVGAVTPQEQKPYTERSKDGIYDAKDTVASAVTPQEEKPYTERAKEGLVSAKDAVVGAVTPQEDKTYTERIKETVAGAKDSVVGTAEDAKKRTSDAATYDDQKPYTERAKEVLGDAKDRVVDATYNAKDTVAGAAQNNAGGAQGTGYGTESIPPSDAAKSWTEKTKETLSGVAGTVGSKLGYGANNQESSTTVTGEQKPLTQRVQESAISAKDAIATKLGYSTSTAPGTGKPVNEAVDETVQQAKDSATVTKEAVASRFQPDEHDKDLSERITSTLGNLGLGSPRGTSTGDVASPTDGEKKGVFGRVSDSVSSLIWKKPAASGEEQDAPADHFTEGVKQIGEGVQQTSRNVAETTETTE